MFPAISLRLKSAFVVLARLPVWSVVKFFGVVMLVSYAYLAMQIRMTNAHELRRLRTDVEKLQLDYVVMTDSLQGRLQALEATTYVDIIQELEKKKLLPPVLETWQKNRDALINRRLEALERRLYAVEAPR